jgi:hypothetical protein
MADRFLKEAKWLLDCEGGRASIPATQALCILYTISAAMGRDRAGLMYRLAAYEWLKRLTLEAAFEKLDETIPRDLLEREVISQSTWGVFCFERYVELTSFLAETDATTPV